MTDVGSLDLRSTPFEALKAADGWDQPERDFFADEAVIWGRFVAFLDALGPHDWVAPVSASDAGGPDWTVLDHVAHLAAWEDYGLDFVVRALDGEPWPTMADVGGDLDTFNETQRGQWTGRSATDVRAWVAEARERLLPALRRVPSDVLQQPAAWDWTFFLVHGHVLEHLAILGPWRAARGGPD